MRYGATLSSSTRFIGSGCQDSPLYPCSHFLLHRPAAPRPKHTFPNNGSQLYPAVCPTYNPPQHLLAHWNAADLRMRFQAFRDNLRYVRNEPELVFERLIGSLNHGFEITANQHHTVVDVLCAENKRLLESARQLRAEPTQSHANRQPEPPPGESAVQASHVVNSVVDLRVGPTAQNADSVRLVCKFIATAKEVHVLCKTSTVACPIPLAGCTWADIGHVDPTFQSGQTTFSSGILGQMVTFATPFLKDAEVLAWLTHIDYRGEVPVKAACEDISTTGFRLNLTIFYWDEGDASFMWKMAVTPKEAEVY